MKIAFICFPMEKVGGIRTWMTEFEIGNPDIQVDEFFITTNNTRKPEPYKNEFNIKNILGFEKEEWLEELKTTLNNYDGILFHVMCPHKLKNYTKTTWKKVYDVLDLDKVIVRLTDPYMIKYYPWMSEVISKKNLKVLVCQEKFESSTNYFNYQKFITHNPYNQKIKDIDFSKKEENLIDINNFKGCKHKEGIINFNLSNIKRIIEYGDNTNLDFKLFEEKTRNMNEINKNKIELKGWCLREDIFKELEKAKYGLDCSSFSNVDMNMDFSLLEYIDFGVIPYTYLRMDKYYPFEVKIINKSRINDFEYNIDIIKENKKKLDICNPKKVLEDLEIIFKEKRKENVRWW